MMPASRISPKTSLRALLQDIVDVTPADDCEVSGFAIDSRDVKPGYVFIACQGESQHGLVFLAEAVNNGAVAVLTDTSVNDNVKPISSSVALIEIENLTDKLGEIAKRFYANPTTQLDALAVTGTNGKSSCAWYLAQLLSKGKSCGFIGTIGTGMYPDLSVATHTTPDIFKVNELLAGYVRQGAAAAVMEVSSHGISQHRIDGLQFKVAAFTNLSRDHLDYHGSIENYFASKSRLFTEHAPNVAVINTDDSYGRKLAKIILAGGESKLFTFGSNEFESELHLQYRNVTAEHTGIRFELIIADTSKPVFIPLLGLFNIENALTVIGVMLGLGWNIDEIIALLKTLQPAPGRMQTFKTAAGALVVVDYAHTPDALKKSIASLKQIIDGQVTCVFGCGGDRDIGKRPQMGAVAEDNADKIILTNDNPRSEQPVHIIKDILMGIINQDKVEVVLDRKQAITVALNSAGEGDAVLIAGKGHEEYQLVSGERYEYSDIKTVQELLGV